MLDHLDNYNPDKINYKQLTDLNRATINFNSIY